MTTIGLIGEHDPGNETHVATDDALGHAATALGIAVEAAWVSTVDVVDAARDLARFGGLLVAPGSPYRSMEGALRAIEHARRHDVPLLGTCGGFQHVVIEYARNVLGIADAQHAELDPFASTLLVTPLSCSVAGQALTVEVRPGTRAGHAYGTARVTERYYCNFGLAPDRVDDLVGGGLCISGTDDLGEVRIVEVPRHRFFVAALFVPQARSTAAEPHPLVTALVAAATRATVADRAATVGGDVPRGDAGRRPR